MQVFIKRIGTVFNERYYEEWGYEQRVYGVDKTYLEILCWANKYASFNIFNGKGRKALDVGCGLGHLAYMLANYGYDVHALDNTKYAIRRAKEDFRRLNINVNLRVHDIHEPLSFHEYFDLICCMRALEHFHNPMRAVSNIISALKPGGIFVAWSSNKFAVYRRILHRNPKHLSVKSPLEWHRLFQCFKPRKLIIECYTWVPLSTRRLIFLKTPLIGRGIRFFYEKS